ncbi:hypothetical protein [Paralcaligenes ureilyticus]|uniref:hypothetical protein n=1 Tax=Paralcaligenes ureilyticus TaxID=627131 RepID=UPI00104FF75E|nr:hypothetical protein [Paralcaligenes ureilyticus]
MLMKNTWRNVLIGMAYIALLMFGVLAQSAQACPLPKYVQTAQMAAGHMPCQQGMDAHSAVGCNFPANDQTSTRACFTQAWMPSSQTPFPSSPEPIVVAAGSGAMPVLHTEPTAGPVAATIPCSRRNTSLSILYCSFQI